jgi:quercetin dioxygenase-like cupin family protein
MLTPIRRVVTGHTPEGRSTVISDGPTPARAETPVWPGRGQTAIWVTNQAPASNKDDALPDLTSPLPGFGEGAGSAFVVIQIPPESELDTMDPDQREKATTPVARIAPNLIEVDTSKHFGMHATDTVDYLIMLSGELTLLLDEAEVTLKPFDTVIQRGTNRSWVNRGTEPALIAASVHGAEPLDRKTTSDSAH